eukprot:SAG31_NODE_2940_length_4882_cov_7.133807_5_plen_118_part_00
MQSFDVERLMRRERVLHRAKLLKDSASLPANLARYEKEALDERSRLAEDPEARKRARALRLKHERDIGVVHPRFQPKLTKKNIPDFRSYYHAKQSAFASKMQEKKDKAKAHLEVRID